MPQVSVRLLEALADEYTSTSGVPAIIENDPALASKMLALANSAYYGLAQKVTSITRAVVVIGFREIRMLSLGASLASVFDPSKMPPGFDAEGLWAHSLGVAAAAHELAKMALHPLASELQMAGLLHDMGKLAAAVCLGEATTELLKQTAEGKPYYQAEADIGLEHTRIGYWLAHHWGLPSLLAQGCRWHHEPEKSKKLFQEMCLLNLADRLAKALRLGVVHAAPELKLSEVVAGTGLQPKQVETAAKKLQEEVPLLLQAWGLIV
jgi:HD-like signal output (HDOD) protein